jgi:uncharacterized protein (DUF4415 family)
MAVSRTVIKTGQKPTKKQLGEMKEGAKRKIVFDEDSPELSKKQIAEFAALAKKRREEKRKPVLALRISPSTMKFAKSLGKGYTGVLSRILDEAVKDPDIVKKCL